MLMISIYQASCTHEQKAHDLQATMANKMMLFVTLTQGLCQTIRSTFEPVFLLTSTDWLCLLVAQMSRCRDLVIFVVTAMTDRQGQALPPVCPCP